VVSGRASSRLSAIPRGVWALGFVSMFMDISSEMIHALLPLYLVGVLGTSTLTVGFIEGIAEATALITRIFSGALSDWLGRRKLLAAIGYGLAAFTKPVFPLANSLGCRLLRNPLPFMEWPASLLHSDRATGEVRHEGRDDHRR
jgi:MFS family permease